MKRFLAIFIGSATSAEKAKWDANEDSKRQELVQRGMQAWGEWVKKHQDSIIDFGSPLGKTKRVGRDGISDLVNKDTAYVIVQAESHEAAARIFVDHAHFSIFPGDSIEIMECLPMPGASES